MTNGTLNALGWAFVVIGAGLTAGWYAIGWRRPRDSPGTDTTGSS